MEMLINILSAVGTSLGILCGLTGVLAVVLLIAEKYLADFGICKITINDEKQLEVKGGSSLLSSLTEHKIFIPSACGGRSTCGYCRVKVKDGAGPILPTEEPLLSDAERADGVRLSCCVRVRNDVSIELPESILSLREYRTRVERFRNLTHDIKEIRLALIDPPEVTFAAGQYVQFCIPPYGKSLDTVYRAYSIATPPSEKHALEFVIRLAPGGLATTYIFERMKEGDTFTINGPYGDFYLRDTDAEIIFIAGATGVAPIRSVLHHMVEQNITHRKATFYFGCVKRSDLFYEELMRDFEAKLPNFTFVPALSKKAPEDDWSGEEGLITDVVDRHVESPSSAEGYLCGSPGMIDACLKVLNGKGITNDRIFYDKFE